MCHLIASISCICILSASVGAVSHGSTYTACAAELDEDGPSVRAQDDPRIERTWVREWSNFSKYYLAFEGGYVCFPTYNPAHGGSSLMSVEEYQRETAYEMEYQDEHSRDRSTLITKPIEEAHAALWSLSEPSIGVYGYIHSGKIDQIVSPNELILQYVHLIDGDRVRSEFAQELVGVRDLANELVTGNARQAVNTLLRDAVGYRFADRFALIERQKDIVFKRMYWRIIGYNTENLVELERWPQGDAAVGGLQLAVVAVEGDTVTAVPAVLLQRELTELAFLDVLESRGLTKNQFVQLVTQARREHGRGYIPETLRLIEGADAEMGEQVDPEEDLPVNDTVELAD